MEYQRVAKLYIWRRRSVRRNLAEAQRENQNDRRNHKPGNRPCNADIEQHRARAQRRLNSNEGAERSNQRRKGNEERQRR